LQGKKLQYLMAHLIKSLGLNWKKSLHNNSKKSTRKGIKRKMKLRNRMLKSQRNKNRWLRLLYFSTYTTQRNNNHQCKGMDISKLTMVQHRTRKEMNMEAHGRLK
jgi:hypothetical protein